MIEIKQGTEVFKQGKKVAFVMGDKCFLLHNLSEADQHTIRTKFATNGSPISGFIQPGKIDYQFQK